jgi:hypothetical protein
MERMMKLQDVLFKVESNGEEDQLVGSGRDHWGNG